MPKTLAYKLIASHLLDGDLEAGKEVCLKINQTLTQDSTGTMVYLQLEALDVDKLATDLSVAYIDHNMLQAGFENADDHAFIQSAAEKYGLIFSKPGGGICHQVHLERFGRPGATLIGSDSHTPTAGGLGSLAIGAGGLDVAVAMAKGFYFLTLPKVYEVYLEGSLKANCNAKDVILTILKKLSVKGGVGYIMEYTGPGVKSLSVPDRATICNMGAELGATSSVFPSDQVTQDFLRAHHREEDVLELGPDPGASYDARLEIDLSAIEPMVAKPHSPDAVVPVSEIDSLKVDQVAIGSCTNSSYADLMAVAQILKGHRVHPDVSLVISPGSANILKMLAENGALATMIASGARILESACGPCIGMGQAPKSKGISLRTFNRNFKGRSGTKDAQIYLVSPQTAASSAIKGYLTPGQEVDIPRLSSYDHVDDYFIYPKEKDQRRKDLVMGPNIKPFPLNDSLEDQIQKRVLLKVQDNVTTDDIVPSHAGLLPYRSNIPHLAHYAFSTLVDDFYDRAKENDGGFILAGDNYGQGSSREHAALVPLYLGVKAVLAKSFARIHRSNLINSGILPLTFADPAIYGLVDPEDELLLDNLHEGLTKGQILAFNKTKGLAFSLEFKGSPRELAILLAGGNLNYSKNLEV
ncbi:aconitate hydratase [Urinicoccus timonensis]|uniref:aconitate hydratase n=1 Tax=Urinicoccus timonensis TaxID=2024205 RepID=UPI000C07F913|nr:aconitate hydratase [Urinicoccus timonensis]